MPVRSLSSPVLRWPNLAKVHRAATAWAQETIAVRSDVERIGYGGSYARRDWGVGSDLDLFVVLTASDRAFMERGRDFDTTALPVPVDLLVYTAAEWPSVSPRHPAIVWLVPGE